MTLLQRGRWGLLVVLLATLLLPSASLRSTVPAASAQAGSPAPAPMAQGVYTGVRLTYYTVSGKMYSGLPTFEGAAAAHLNWLPVGTRFSLDCLPGHVYTVLDTGRLPPYWVDIYVASAQTGRWLTSVCGDYVTVRVEGATAPAGAPGSGPGAAPTAPSAGRDVSAGGAPDGAAPAAESADAALPTALAEAIRANLTQRGMTSIPSFTVEVLARDGDWVRVLMLPDAAGVERAVAFLHATVAGWQLVAGPGGAIDPDWLRSLGVPESLIGP